MKILLGIVGENLDPAIVSAALGGEPRKSGKKGDLIGGRNTRGQSVSKAAIAGYWQRAITVPSGKSGDAAVQELFAGLTEDTATWQQLSSQFRAEIAVQGVPRGVSPGALFSQETLALFRHRGLHMVLREK